MDRQVGNYLKDRGYAVEASAGRDGAGAEPRYSEWFETREVLSGTCREANSYMERTVTAIAV